MEMSNEEVLDFLVSTNHWVTAETAKSQGASIDDVTIYETRYKGNDEPGVFVVSYRCYDPEKEGKHFSQQYWRSEFAIRDYLGNPTALGKRLGISARDKKVSIFSPEGREIEELLHRIASTDACRLTEDRSKIKDSTYLAKTNTY